MARENLYQHFNKSEQQFIDKCFDLVHRVESYYVPQLTDFLNPRQVFIAKSVFGQSGVKFFISSDYYPLEYARILVAPDYYEVNVEDFELALINISYQAKFHHLSHSQILGTFLNRLGIQRHLLGDILVTQGQAQVVLAQSLVSLVRTDIQKIAGAGVRLEDYPMTKLMPSDELKTERQILVSSYRLDKLVASLTGLSRQQAQTLIGAKRTKVNYQEIDKPDYLLDLGDLLSIRGFGRYRLLDDSGQTKTGKHKLLIEEMSKKKEK